MGHVSKPTVCVPNIGPRARAKRAKLGIAFLAVGAALALALILSGADRWWRVALVLPFWAGAIGIIEALEKT